MKIPISTIRAIIKNFQSTENVMNLPGRGHVSISALMHGEKESLSGQRLFKDHSWRIAEKRLSFGIRKPKKNCQTAPTSPHVVQEGFKKNSPHSSKNNLQHIQLSDTTGTSNGTGFYGQMKLKNELFSSKHSRWVWWTLGLCTETRYQYGTGTYVTGMY